MTPLHTERLLLRNWTERDRPLFHRINSDEQVMRYFPFRRERAECDAKMDEFAAGIDRNGYGFAAAEIVATGETIGFVGLKTFQFEPHIPAGSIEIGWRLAPEYWHQGYATEAANAWLDFGFEKLGVDEIVSFAVWNNTPSLTVMQRIGMRRDAAADFDHPDIPEDRPDLRRSAVYRISREDWQRKGGPKPA